ncbi:hypothetical protein [Azohydromonas aeria]|uniref:hypothetical protein n=1 Tax=Azohydromonas aeria TaxID=2590212 RepID=UPI0012FBE51E|nr:hypothetical protein [Azohydromonas aeria]
MQKVDDGQSKQHEANNAAPLRQLARPDEEAIFRSSRPNAVAVDAAMPASAATALLHG